MINSSSRSTTTLMISNEEINDIMKTVKSLEECGLLKKGATETITNEAKEQKKWVSKYVIRCIRD